MPYRLLIFLGLLGFAAPAFARPAPGTGFHEMFATNREMSITTSTAFPPNIGFFGNIQNADWQVTFAAAEAGRRGSAGWNGSDTFYKAIISINGNNAIDRISVNGPIYNTHGELLAASKVDLFDGRLLTPVDYDEYGTLIASNPDVWTGTVSSGMWSGNSCGNWNNPSNTVSGRLGDSFSDGPIWLDIGASKPCNQSARLYGLGPLLTAPLWGDYDENGVVDGGDFLVWQRSLGTQTSLPNSDWYATTYGVGVEELAVWKEYFGQSLPLAANVPEPAGIVLVIIAMQAGNCLWQRQSPTGS